MVVWIGVWDMVMNQWKTGSHFSLTEAWLNFYHRTLGGTILLSSFPWQCFHQPLLPWTPNCAPASLFSLYPPVMFIVNQLCFSLCSSSVSPQLSGFPAPKLDLIRPQKCIMKWCHRSPPLVSRYTSKEEIHTCQYSWCAEWRDYFTTESGCTHVDDLLFVQKMGMISGHHLPSPFQ